MMFQSFCPFFMEFSCYLESHKVIVLSLCPFFLSKQRYFYYILLKFYVGVEYNFKKYRPGQASTLGEPYDKQSVMHYGK